PEALTPADVPNTPSPQIEFASMMTGLWGPATKLLAFQTIATFKASAPNGPTLRTETLSIYDPSTKSTRVLVKNNGRLSLTGWLDTQHLLYRVAKQRFIYDLSTGQSQPAPQKTPPLASRAADPASLTTVSTGRDQKVLVDDNEQPVIADTQNYGNATELWVRRQAGPIQRNRLLVDVFRGPPTLGWSPGSETRAQFAPNGGFDRQGAYQVAYLAQGDLKVCDLAIRDATLMEKAMAGEKLPCNQQRLLASENAKQLGLAIIQYAQDYDEHFPAGDGFPGSITPYLRPDMTVDLPNIAPFKYLPPADLSLAAAESPATTPIGTYDLPCATVTVYMDGHVSSVDKSAPGG
ncbi:MAG TPA: hypothetical protein VFW40_01880, partial [Capsulimonadaceae bacterium]|nr:hypothetical protein [Capsulimonadaceae bacterium]